MPKVPLKFVIINNGLQYYQNAGGGISTSPTPVYLEKSIVDWNTLCLNYKRDSTFLGVIRSYSPQKVRFVNDAAKILRYIKNTQGGIEAIAYLGVYTLNTATQTYQILDYWQFDFSQTSNSQFYFECALMDGGLSALLKANGNINYNVPLNDPSLVPNFPVYNSLPADQINLLPPINPATNANVPVPKLFFIDGIPIMGRFQFATNTLGERFKLWGSHDSIFALGLDQSNSFGDFNGSLGTVNTPLMANVGGGGMGNTLTTILFQAALAENGITSSAPKISINYNLQFYYKNTGPDQPGVKLKLQYAIWNTPNTDSPQSWNGQDGRNVLIWEDTDWLPALKNRVLNLVGKTPTFTMQHGQMLVVGFSYDTEDGSELTADGGVGVNFAEYDITNIYPLPAITLNGSFVPPSSVCRVISHNDLFNYLRYMMATSGGLLTNVDGVPNLPYASRSKLLSTARDPVATGNYDLNPTDTWFTCGDSLRGLSSVTIQDPNYNAGNPFTCYVVPAIYTNMQDFAKDLLTDICGSIGIEKNGIGNDVLVAEHLSYFFDDTKVIANLGNNISNFVMEDFNDYLGTSIAIGQEDQQFDSLNGPFETNSEVDWKLPVTRVQNAIDFKTPYRAEALGIEETRANIGNKTNVNSSSDNDTFKLQADGTGVQTVQNLINWGGVSGYINLEESLGSGAPPSENTIIVGTVTANSISNAFFSSQFISQIVIDVAGVSTTYYWGTSFNQSVDPISGMPRGVITGITTGPLPLNFVEGQSITIYGIPATAILALKLQRPIVAALTDPTCGISSGLPDNLLEPAVALGGVNFGWYNLAFSPQRKVLRAAPWLCSNFYGLLGKLMAMSAYKKNVKLVSNLGSGPVTELNWINLSDTTAQTYTPPYSLKQITVPPQPIPAGKTTVKLFIPKTFSFTSPVPIDLPIAMTPPLVSDGAGGWIANPLPGGGKMYGKIEFIFERDNIEYPLAGFVLEAGITPGTNATYNYKLLCSPTVNIPPTL